MFSQIQELSLKKQEFSLFEIWIHQQQSFKKPLLIESSQQYFNRHFMQYQVNSLKYQQSTENISYLQKQHSLSNYLQWTRVMGNLLIKQDIKDLYTYLSENSKHLVGNNKKIILNSLRRNHSSLLQITQIVLSKCTSQGLTIMLPLKNKLLSLRIIQKGICDNHVMTLCKEFKTLQQLYLRGHNITDSSVRKILRNLKNLYILDLAENKLSLNCKQMVKKKTKNFDYVWF